MRAPDPVRDAVHLDGVPQILAHVDAEIEQLNEWIARLGRVHHNQELRRRVEQELDRAVAQEPR